MPYKFSQSKYPAVPKQRHRRTVREKPKQEEAQKKERFWQVVGKIFGLVLVDIAGILLTEFGVGPAIEAMATSELAATIGTTIASSVMEVGFNFLGDAISGIGVSRSSLFINLIPIGGAEGFAKLSKVLKSTRVVKEGIKNIEKFGIRLVRNGKEVIVNIPKADLEIMRKNPSIVRALFEDDSVSFKKYAYASGETIESLREKQFKNIKDFVNNNTNKKLRWGKNYRFVKKMNELSDNEFWKTNNFFKSGWEKNGEFTLWNQKRVANSQVELKKRFYTVEKMKSYFSPFYKKEFQSQRKVILKGTPQWLFKKLKIIKTENGKEVVANIDKEVAAGLANKTKYTLKERFSLISRVAMSWVALLRFIDPATTIRGLSRQFIRGTKSLYRAIEKRTMRTIEEEELVGLGKYETKTYKWKSIKPQMRQAKFNELGRLENDIKRYGKTKRYIEHGWEYRAKYKTHTRTEKAGFFKVMDRLAVGRDKIRRTISRPLQSRVAKKIYKTIGQDIGFFPLNSKWIDSFTIISTLPEPEMLLEIGGNLQIFFKKEATIGPSNPNGKRPITTNFVRPEQIAQFQAMPGNYYLDNFAYMRDWVVGHSKAASPLEIQRYAWMAMKSYRRVFGRNGISNATKQLAKWNSLKWDSVANKSGKIFMLEAGHMTGFGSLINPFLTSVSRGRGFDEGIKSTLDRYVSTLERRYRRLHYNYDNRRKSGHRWKRIKSIF
jgi:hypothetical protein